MFRLRLARYALACVIAGCTNAPVTAWSEPSRAPGCTPTDESLGPVFVPGDPLAPLPGHEDSADWPGIETFGPDTLSGELERARSIDTETFLADHHVPRTAELAYDPLAAVNLDLAMRSALALDADERAVLAERGLVISDRQRYWTFAQGYEAIYVADLPVFISADSILHALHRSVDELLAEVEREALRSLLDAALSGLVAGLAEREAVGETSAVLADVDAYLAVAIALLRDSAPAPIAGADPATVDELHALAMEASGLASVTLFGSEREVDFSSFLPRGHYAVPDLAPYFRAMSWLSQIDLRPVFSDPVTRTRRVDRHQVACGLLLDEIISVGPRAAPLDQLDHIVGLILGEREGARPREMGETLASAGITSRGELEAAGEAELLAALEALGTPRIASRVLDAGFWPDGSVPLPVSVALVPPRYTADAHVLSNLVFDRVGGGDIRRMMPSTLDVAFAVFGNDDAARLLAPELERFAYAPDLAAMRAAVDAHEPGFFFADIYHSWLYALRALSPRETTPDALPPLARTDAWGRRVLNTQIASWAELRHDTVLYAAQSYTGSVGCEYPDAYVEPSAEFFFRMAAVSDGLLALGGEIERIAPALGASVRQWARSSGRVHRTLADIAERQRTGALLTAEQLEFVNSAVSTGPSCGGAGEASGWYRGLFFSGEASAESMPVVADVHTQPTDADGNDVGRVLHVGTGYPRLMAVTFDSCEGPRLYLGLVSSHYELVTQGWDRLDDERFARLLNRSPPDDVPWLRDLIVRWPVCE